MAIAVLLGVILSIASAGTASAYYIEATAHCHATGVTDNDTGRSSCVVGSPVTITPKAQGGTGNETFDFDSDTFENGSTPEVRGAKSVTFTYNTPGSKNVGITATDGSGSNRGYGVEVTDPDGKPDPNLQPSLAADTSGFYARKEGSVCVVDWRAFFTAYRDFAYNARLYAGFRQRVRTARGSRIRKGRLQLVRQQRLRRASYDSQKHLLLWRFDRRSPRIQRLIRKRAVVRVSLRERVSMDGQTVYRQTKLRRFNLGRCSFN